jgi:hypothetical protein
MKQLLIMTSLLFVSFGLSACTEQETTITQENELYTEIDTIIETLELSTYGSDGAINDTEYTLEEMLIYALQDEYAARAEYEYILENFDVTTPFSNIIKSEETHISLLLPLFETYGLDELEDTSSEHLIPPTDLAETFAIGVIAEIKNIEMYNLFLEDDTLPDDVRDVFIKLRDASINHLEAFEKNAAKY